MSLTICIYEDDKFSQFYPLTYFRPVYLLRPGIEPLCKKVKRFFPEAKIVYLARDIVSAMVGDEHRDTPVNIIKRGDGHILFLNGRVRDYGDLPKLVKESRLSTVFQNGSEKIGLLLMQDSISSVSALATITEYMDIFKKENEIIPDFDTTATLYGYCWEIVEDIEKCIIEDYNLMKSSLGSSGPELNQEGVFLINKEDIYLGAGVSISPNSVIDASKGPVIVGENTLVESHAAILGPCYIGANSVILAGRISGCSIGHTCRVGGEVEESIFHSYVNKYHSGFIGHSYVGSWVNFGAMTTNSDLKNNYSNIRLDVNGQSVDSGSIKVGSFIGDNTKFGIGTLLNTGISVGPCCNIFGGNILSDKEIAPFKWGETGNFVQYELDKAIETIKRSMKRRQVELSKNQESALRAVYSGDNLGEGVVVFR